MQKQCKFYTVWGAITMTSYTSCFESQSEMSVYWTGCLGISISSFNRWIVYVITQYFHTQSCHDIENDNIPWGLGLLNKAKQTHLDIVCPES